MPLAPVTAAALAAFQSTEQEHFALRHGRSRELATAAAAHFLYGVPMHWMRDWPSPWPVFVSAAHGARLHTADGVELTDFCLGDTGAMFGHSPPAIARVLAEYGSHGLVAMLPTPDAVAVGELLGARFGLPVWQLATTASDANRFALRWARAVTGRPCILVFNGCYHGTVDDTLVDLVAGQPRMRASLLGQVHDLATTTRVVEFNDLAAVRAALADGQVACVLTEPVLTNIGMVLPAPGFLAGVQEAARATGTLFIVDETHTLSCGPGGYSRAHGLAPDMLVLGKPVAGGTPAAVYGFSADLAARMAQVKADAPPGHSGIGTTLTAGMLTLRLLRAMLAEVMSEAAYAQMFMLAARAAQGLEAVIAKHALPWSVTCIGARAEYQFCPTRPRNGREAAAAQQPELSGALHLALLNRGVLLTPFHNMLLCSPAHTVADIDLLIEAFEDSVRTLLQA